MKGKGSKCEYLYIVGEEGGVVGEKEGERGGKGGKKVEKKGKGELLYWVSSDDCNDASQSSILNPQCLYFLLYASLLIVLYYTFLFYMLSFFFKKKHKLWRKEKSAFEFYVKLIFLNAYFT